MVDLFLPKSSKVKKGKFYKLNVSSENPIILSIYRWNPENNENPRLDSYEIDQKKCGPMVLDALIFIKFKLIQH